MWRITLTYKNIFAISATSEWLDSGMTVEPTGLSSGKMTEERGKNQYLLETTVFICVFRPTPTILLPHVPLDYLT